VNRTLGIVGPFNRSRIVKLGSADGETHRQTGRIERTWEIA
jgi:hypothetical protein